MPEELINSRKLMAMASKFSGYRIDPKYFPLMFESPFIIESLNHIYILDRNRKLSIEDMQEIKRVFREYFSFFAEPSNTPMIKKYSKKYLVLSIVFFILLIASGISCIYLPIISFPLVFISVISLIGCACLININTKTYSSEITDIQDSFKHELFDLKYNLNQLKNALADKYQLKKTHAFFDHIATLLAFNRLRNFQNKKKSVSFAPKLNELNMFFIESPEIRSRANSYESNGNLQPKA
ncbi:hypothetical protein [Rickettsiella endosymbiont of Miltochrista miniata]|uniref:hypothetical protein n=1 Tax=Rickettsiella endosymbiont of Miltochrista miniata TaxID=3066239 RepID=UPI00313ED304